jgi:hypothetical protein
MVRTTVRVAMVAVMAGSVLWAVLRSGMDDEVPPLMVPVMVITLLLPFYFTIGQLRSGNSRALRSAPLGVGTITGVRRTGLAVSDRPQVAIGMTVRTGDGHAFDAVAKEFVDTAEIGSLTPGTVLPVRYLPGRSVVKLDRGADTTEAQAVLTRVHVHDGLVSPHLLDVIARGVTATAVVGAARATGRLVAGHPELVLTLLVTRPDGTAFEATVDKVVPANLVGHVQVGRVRTVHYLPGAEHDIALQLPANP